MRARLGFDRVIARVAPVLAVALLAAVPLLTDDRYLFKVLTFVGLNVIVVTGLALLFGYAGQISLGHAAFFGIGAYSVGYLTATRELPWLAAVAIGVALASVVGLLLSLPMLRLKGHYLAMATLAFSEILGVFFVEASSITGGNDGLRGIPFPSVGSFRIATPGASYLLVWGVAIIVVALAANLVRTRPGRALRAVHGTELGAQACGIDTGRLRVQVFTLSAGLAGLAGALYAGVVGFVSPTTFSLEFSVLLVAMVVLGGTGSIAGPVIACVALTLLPYVDALVPGLPREAVAFLQDWEADISGIVMIGVLLFAPGGVAGMFRRSRRAGDAS